MATEESRFRQQQTNCHRQHLLAPQTIVRMSDKLAVHLLKISLTISIQMELTVVHCGQRPRSTLGHRRAACYLGITWWSSNLSALSIRSVRSRLNSWRRVCIIDGTHRIRIINNHSSNTIGGYLKAIVKGIPDSLGLSTSWGYLECVPGFPVVQLSGVLRIRMSNQDSFHIFIRVILPILSCGVFHSSHHFSKGNYSL